MSQQRLVVREVENRVLEVITPGPQGPSGSAGGVTKINAGNNVSITPTNGLGEVTINSTGSGSGGGTVTQIIAGTGLTGGTITTTGTIAVDVGTTSGKIVQLTTGSTPKLPVLNGSNLTNLPGSDPTSNYAGQATITTLGTITTGTWNASVIPAANGGTGLTSISTLLNSNIAIVSDTTPQLGGNLDVNGKDIVSAGNGPIDLDPDGSGKVVFRGNSTRGSGQFVLNCEQNSHGVTVKGPPHTAAADYTLTLPPSDGASGQVLNTDGSGVLDWTTLGTAATKNVGTSNTNVVQLDSTGLPVVNGSQVTNLNASALTTGVVDSSRLSLDVRTLSYSGEIETASEKEYTIDPYVSRPRTIFRIYVKCASGSGTVIVKTDGSTVKTINFSQTAQNVTAGLASTNVSLGSTITFDISTNNSALGVVFSIETYVP